MSLVLQVSTSSFEFPFWTHNLFTGFRRNHQPGSLICAALSLLVMPLGSLTYKWLSKVGYDCGFERSLNCLQLRVRADGFGYDQVIKPTSKFPARRQGFVHLYSLLNVFGCICAAYPEQIVKVLKTDNKALMQLACRNNFHRQEQFKQMITCECSLSCAHTLHESKVK